jgi:hypothetical protein
VWDELEVRSRSRYFLESGEGEDGKFRRDMHCVQVKSLTLIRSIESEICPDGIRVWKAGGEGLAS